MENLRRAVRVNKVVVGTEETGREYVSSTMIVKVGKGTSVDDVRTTGVHPGMLIERHRGQIESQPVLNTSHLDQWELAIFVRVDQLSRPDRFA
jgi:hypothetical protein